MTVGRALSMVGGLSDKGSLPRSYIRRMDEATKTYKKVKGLKLETLILPNDELVIEKKFF